MRLLSGNKSILSWNFVINKLAPRCGRRLRFRLYRLSGLNIRTHRIMDGCMIVGRNISIGANSFLNTKCLIDAEYAPVTIGANCNIGYQVMICSTTHDQGTSENRAGQAQGRPIAIGDGCWIGARAVILPGVTIGDGCVIAAGAVVNRDCEPDGMYAGVPARKVKSLP